ncbi:MAG TPA: DDE-type integrase/transposase/recombinase, partial [Amaricoccus sp.]|nr:DDE-type integrase/transposase/recombinase [Amaricoccus sp.]
MAWWSRAPNDLWCCDFKCEFRLGNGRLCHPLTVTDRTSRFILMVEALEGVAEAAVFTAFHRLFEQQGLPLAIRSDNGVPFASRGLYGLSKLPVWWLRPGIGIERITPGHPQQNGAHERMHLTLKQETTRPQPPTASPSRPDSMPSPPTSTPSVRTRRPTCRPPPPATPPRRDASPACPSSPIPFHDLVLVVSGNGAIGLHGRHVLISSVFAGQRLGLREVDTDGWLVSF